MGWNCSSKTIVFILTKCNSFIKKSFTTLQEPLIKVLRCYFAGFNLQGKESKKKGKTIFDIPSHARKLNNGKIKLVFTYNSITNYFA